MRLLKVRGHRVIIDGPCKSGEKHNDISDYEQ